MGTQLFSIKPSIKEIYRSVDWCQLSHPIALEHIVIFFYQKYVIVWSRIHFIIVLIR